jgi:uncharacterized membrane protein
MSSLVSTEKKTAKRKGWTAAAVAGGSVAAALAISPVLGVIGLVGAGYLTYDWFMYRAKRGMRF